MKPKKKLYKNQEEIKEKFLDFIQPFFKKYPQITRAFLFSSLTNKTFGIYEKEYKNNKGSDIDLVVFIKGTILKEWKEFKAQNKDFTLYKDNQFRKFIYKNNAHKVDIVIPHKKIVKQTYSRIK